MFKTLRARLGASRLPDAAPAAAAFTAVLLLGGCVGRTDVSTGPDSARNLPEKPHYTPQQHPSPSTLQSVQEPTPAAQE